MYVIRANAVSLDLPTNSSKILLSYWLAESNIVFLSSVFVLERYAWNVVKFRIF